MIEKYADNHPLSGNSSRQLESKLLYLSNLGGSGGSSAPQTYAAAGGTSPTGILTARGTTDIAINTTDGSIYWYYSGSWNP